MAKSKHTESAIEPAADDIVRMGAFSVAYAHIEAQRGTLYTAQRIADLLANLVDDDAEVGVTRPTPLQSALIEISRLIGTALSATDAIEFADIRDPAVAA